VEVSKEEDVVGLMIVTEVTWVIGAEEIIEEILGTTGVTEWGERLMGKLQFTSGLFAVFGLAIMFCRNLQIWKGISSIVGLVLEGIKVMIPMDTLILRQLHNKRFILTSFPLCLIKCEPTYNE
jgi:hypothetical protein